MIIDHRTYTLRPGTMAQWLRKYETEGLPIQKRHLGRFVGLFTTEVGNLHQVVFLWAYDSQADREARRARLAGDPEWQKYMDELWAMDAIQAQEIKLLKSASFSPI